MDRQRCSFSGSTLGDLGGNIPLAALAFPHASRVPGPSDRLRSLA